MEWDAREGHRHWHFTDFAQYNLLAADKKLAVRSGKEAFCLANTDAVDYTIPNAKWRPEQHRPVQLVRAEHRRRGPRGARRRQR